MKLSVLAQLAIAVSMVLAAQSALAAQKIAVMPFDINVERQSWERPKATAAEAARLGLVTEKLRSLLSESDAYEVLDVSALEPDIKEAAPFFKCNGCDVDIGKKAGAALVATGIIQKSSETLLNVSILVRDVASGELKQTMAVSIRQNTDAGWLRGVRWLVRNRLLSGNSK